MSVEISQWPLRVQDHFLMHWLTAKSFWYSLKKNSVRGLNEGRRLNETQASSRTGLIKERTLSDRQDVWHR